MRKYFATVIISAVAIFSGLLMLAILLPEFSYLRYQLLKQLFAGETQWIYERIHFDKRPLDVVIVGASNAQYGISPARLQEDLGRHGLPVGVVNFSMIVGGRNVNYAVIKEMFKAGWQPKMLVLGVTWRPAHFGHPAFKYLADTEDVIDAVYPINANYLTDLSYLPFRQLKLLAMNWFPGAFHVNLHFDAASYQGVVYDPPVMVRLPAGNEVDIRENRMTRESLLQRSREEDGMHQLSLPESMAGLEFGDEYFYVPKIAALAQAHGTKVVFLYIPPFQGPPESSAEGFYGQYGPVFNANFVRDSDQLFADPAHLNHEGALRITDWFADRAASLLGAVTVAKPSPRPCGSSEPCKIAEPIP